MALLCWMVSVLPAIATLRIPTLEWRIAAVVLFSVVFAAGEAFIAPSMQPLAARLAPGDKLPVYTAATSMAYSLGLLIGPALLLLVFTSFGGIPYWILMAAGISTGLLLLRFVPKVATPTSPVAVETSPPAAEFATTGLPSDGSTTAGRELASMGPKQRGGHPARQ